MNDDLNEIREDDMLSENEESTELYEHIRMTVDPGQQPERIDTYLTNHLSNISRNRVQNAAKAGNILVNEKAVKQNYKVTMSSPSCSPIRRARPTSSRKKFR